MSPSRRDILHQTIAVAAIQGGSLPDSLADHIDEDTGEEHTPEDDFQRRLEQLGVTSHWSALARDAQRRRDTGDAHRLDAFDAAVEAHAEPGTDVLRVREEYLAEQKRLIDSTVEVAIDLPPEAEALIDRKVQLMGFDPEDSPGRWIDAALETIDLKFDPPTNDN